MTVINYSSLTRARTHRCPTDVLGDPHLPQARKRGILAEWASDRYAVPSRPWLRHVPGMPEPVPLNDILGALAQLDDDPPPRGGAAAASPAWRASPSTSAKGEPTPALAKALIAAHQRNIGRYYRLLTTHLTDLEKAYVRRRIMEERREVKRLMSEATRAAAGPTAARSRQPAPWPAGSQRGCGA